MPAKPRYYQSATIAAHPTKTLRLWRITHNGEPVGYARKEGRIWSGYRDQRAMQEHRHHCGGNTLRFVAINLAGSVPWKMAA